MDIRKEICVMVCMLVVIGLPECIMAQTKDLNQLLVQLRQEKNEQRKINILSQIGLAYQQQNIHKKAIEYFETAYQLEKNYDLPHKKSLQQLGRSFQQLRNYSRAIECFEEILQNKPEALQEQLAIFNELSILYKIEKNYAKAIETNLKILDVHQKNNDTAQMVSTYNNLGFLYKKIGAQEKSFESYNQAITIGQKLQNNDLNQQAITYINTGVAYTSIGKYRQARGYYLRALKIREQQKNFAQVADTYNYLAVHYYLSGNNAKAISRAKKALELARPVQAEEVMAHSYQLLSEIYQQEKAFEESQKYFKIYQKLKDKLAQQRRKAQQQMLQKQIEVEKQESRLKSIIAAKERKEAELKQTKLEQQKQEQNLRLKEQQLVLLKRNQALQKAEFKNQQLEKDRVEQLLALAEQKARTKKQEILADKRKQEAETQKLVAAKEKAERLQQTKTLALVQQEKKLQQEQLKQEKNLRRYGTIVLILGTLLFGIVLFSFVASRRAHKKLKQQKGEIISQNEALQRNQEEIMSQRDFIEEKNQELAFTNNKLRQGELVLRKAYDELKKSKEDIKEKNDKISQSISAAQTIQSAILPHHKSVQKVLGEHFVIYRPKDVVSGDFYWVKKVQDKTFVIAADCTGHGVPGALMSMIGKTLIDKVILIKDIFNPAQILQKLHEEVKLALRQNETGNNSGMDVVVICLENRPDQQINVTFAGAKTPLYYIANDSERIKIFKGNRRSIGGDQNERVVFTNQEIVLTKGSLLYLGSDGFCDQNDVKRKSFGSKKLISMLEQNRHLTLQQQKACLEEALRQHMVDTQQRDDILYMGVRL